MDEHVDHLLRTLKQQKLYLSEKMLKTSSPDHIFKVGMQLFNRTDDITVSVNNSNHSSQTPLQKAYQNSQRTEPPLHLINSSSKQLVDFTRMHTQLSVPKAHLLPQESAFNQKNLLHQRKTYTESNPKSTGIQLKFQINQKENRVAQNYEQLHKTKHDPKPTKKSVQDDPKSVEKLLQEQDLALKNDKIMFQQQLYLKIKDLCCKYHFHIDHIDAADPSSFADLFEYALQKTFLSIYQNQLAITEEKAQISQKLSKLEQESQTLRTQLSQSRPDSRFARNSGQYDLDYLQIRRKSQDYEVLNFRVIENKSTEITIAKELQSASKCLKKVMSDPNFNLLEPKDAKADNSNSLYKQCLQLKKENLKLMDFIQQLLTKIKSIEGTNTPQVQFTDSQDVNAEPYLTDLVNQSESQLGLDPELLSEKETLVLLNKLLCRVQQSKRMTKIIKSNQDFILLIKQLNQDQQERVKTFEREQYMLSCKFQPQKNPHQNYKNLTQEFIRKLSFNYPTMRGEDISDTQRLIFQKNKSLNHGPRHNKSLNFKN